MIEMSDYTIELMNRARIERALKRMAYQIEEEAKSKDIVLAGLNKRGFILANFLFYILLILNNFKVNSKYYPR